MLSKLLVENDIPSHPDLIKIMNNLSEKSQKNMNKNSKENFPDSIVNLSTSILDTHSTNNPKDNKQQVVTFGKPEIELLRNKSRNRLHDSNQIKIESESSSKYSFSDKGNHINISTNNPSKFYLIKLLEFNKGVLNCKIKQNNGEMSLQSCSVDKKTLKN